jgi:cell division protein FtsL
VVASALSVIVIRDLERQYTSELQMLQRKANQAQLMWGQLQLEKSVWVSPLRVERFVRKNLNMVYPTPKALIIIKRQ